MEMSLIGAWYFLEQHGFDQSDFVRYAGYHEILSRSNVFNRDCFPIDSGEIFASDGKSRNEESFAQKRFLPKNGAGRKSNAEKI